LGDSNPFMPRSKMKAFDFIVMSIRFCPNYETSAIGEFVIQFFAPEI
jgi:hypothetical protein